MTLRSIVPWGFLVLGWWLVVGGWWLWFRTSWVRGLVVPGPCLRVFVVIVV